MFHFFLLVFLKQQPIYYNFHKLEYLNVLMFVVLLVFLNQIKKLTDEVLKGNSEYVQVGYDPRRHGHFYTREVFGNFKKGTVIEEAEEVIQLGPLVLARNPKFSNVKEYEEGGRIMRDPNKNYNTQRAI